MNRRASCVSFAVWSGSDNPALHLRISASEKELAGMTRKLVAERRVECDRHHTNGAVALPRSSASLAHLSVK
jgi:hypothetical protein